MPQPAAPHPIAQSQPSHFQDFSIQTISNQELAPTSTRQTHSNENFTAKVRVGVGGTHKGQKMNGRAEVRHFRPGTSPTVFVYLACFCFCFCCCLSAKLG